MEHGKSKLYFGALLAALLFLAPSLSWATFKHFSDARDPVYKAGLQSFKNRDYSTAFRIWLPLARQGNTKAQYRIGYMYLNGLYVRRDTYEARQWFERAAYGGHPQAQNDLGTLYLNGQGVRRNLDIALDWFERAANQGNPTAQYNLGVTYYSLSRLREAKIWLGASARQGYARATYRLRELFGRI